MVMDTPLGRLDKGHRRHVLELVCEWPTQVILFVQSGEYDAVVDRDLLGHRVQYEYVIERVGEQESRIATASS